MKTLLIFSELPERAADFFIVDGDFRNLEGVYVNHYFEDESEQKRHAKLEKILLDLMYVPSTGEKKLKPLETAPNKDQYDFIVRCGFIL